MRFQINKIFLVKLCFEYRELEPQRTRKLYLIVEQTVHKNFPLGIVYDVMNNSVCVPVARNGTKLLNTNLYLKPMTSF